MKKIYFRILAVCLSLFLTFSILYKDSIQADALEWVGVAVGYDTAFKFLLGLLGVSVGVGVAENVDWGTMRQNAIQVQLDQGNSQADVSQWWSDIIHGSLDTASSCWSSFKSWVSSELAGSSSGVYSVSGCLSNVLGSSFSFDSQYSDYPLSLGFYTYNSNYSQATKFVFFGPQSRVVSLAPYSYTIYCDYMITVNTDYTNHTLSYIYSERNSEVGGSFSSYNYLKYYFFGFGDESYLQSVNSRFLFWDISIDNSSLLEGLYPNIQDIALNPENADTLGVDVIPLPWENIGVSEDAIQDIIDDAIERVIDGTMSLENYWEYVQNITNTYAYSIENNYLLPNENGEDKKADDKVKENTENGAFVLYGLEKVFPFCIPFDIYAFITLLKADPVAPVIEYPIYNPVTQENEIITIDFSEWESVVVIFRYIFDFLLIIGLLLLARPLVGAGGDS